MSENDKSNEKDEKYEEQVKRDSDTLDKIVKFIATLDNVNDYMTF